jgi:uroporphyrinogen-III synthase
MNTRKIPIAVIGPTTAKAARERNLNPEIMPAKSDENSFIEELKRYFGEMARRGNGVMD